MNNTEKRSWLLFRNRFAAGNDRLIHSSTSTLLYRANSVFSYMACWIFSIENPVELPNLLAKAASQRMALLLVEICIKYGHNSCLHTRNRNVFLNDHGYGLMDKIIDLNRLTVFQENNSISNNYGKMCISNMARPWVENNPFLQSERIKQWIIC